MDGIYFFNGKDITMNLCIQIRDVIDIIKEKAISRFKMQRSLFTSPRHTRLCRIQRIRFGQSRRDISQIAFMKSRNKKITVKLNIKARYLRKELSILTGSSFFISEKTIYL